MPVQKLVTEKVKTEKPLNFNGFSAFIIKMAYSHSIVPMHLDAAQRRTQ